MTDEIKVTGADLILMISFDLGDIFEIENLKKILPKEQGYDEKKGEEMMRKVVDPSYLEQKKSALLKLADLKVKIIDDELRELNDRELACELYLLLHNIGIAVVTVWIHLDNVSLSIDQIIKVIKMMTEKFRDAKCFIKKSTNILSQDTNLYHYITNSIVVPLQAAIIFKNEYGGLDKALDEWKERKIAGRDLRKKLRYKGIRVYSMVFIKKYNCSCKTLKEVVKKHSKELVGILTGSDEWKQYRESTAENMLKIDLSLTKDIAFFMIPDHFLGIFSPSLNDYCKPYEEGDYISREEDFIVPIELAVLMEMMISAYYFYLTEKMEMYSERNAPPSEIVLLRKEIEEGLDEYYNIVTIEEPAITIIKHAREILRISEGVQAIKERLSVLDHYIRTRYEEEVTRKQEILTILLCVVGIPPVIEIVWEKTSSVPLVIISGFIFLMAVIIIYKYYSSIYKYCNKISSYISRLFRK
jgi:hypothetical protein